MKNFYFLLLTILLFLFIGGFCFAGGSLELDYPTIGGQTLSVNTDLPSLVKYIFDLALALSGLLAFGVLIFAGVSYLTSAGNPGKMGDASDRIFQAFVGLLILLCSYIILNTINPDLVQNIQTPNVQSTNNTTP